MADNMIEIENDEPFTEPDIPEPNNPGSQIVSKMGQKVPPEWIKKKKVPGRPELDYISIDKTILKLNREFGDNWQCILKNIIWGTHPYLQLQIDGKVWEIKKTVPIVTVSVSLIINGVIREGIGSDVFQPSSKYNDYTKQYPETTPDPDKMVKTAYANAIKKATNLFGFGAELWDEDNVLEPETPPEPQKAPNTAPKMPDKTSRTPREKPQLSELDRTAVNYMNNLGWNKEDMLKFTHDVIKNPNIKSWSDLTEQNKEDVLKAMTSFLDIQKGLE